MRFENKNDKNLPVIDGKRAIAGIKKSGKG